MHVRPEQYTSVNHFHLSSLRKLLKSNGKNPDTEFLKKVRMQSMHTVLKLAQLRWISHAIRMPKESLLCRTTGGEALSRWPKETLQTHPQSLSEGFRHKNGALGTDCTESIKVARTHQQRSRPV